MCRGFESLLRYHFLKKSIQFAKPCFLVSLVRPFLHMVLPWLTIIVRVLFDQFKRVLQSSQFREDIMHKNVVSIIATVLLLSGCGVSASTYATGQQALKGSPAVRSDFIKTCTQRIRNKPLKTRQGIAKVANTSVSAAPRIYCSRLTRGIASGKLTHSDINAASRGQVTPNIVKVLQGR